MISEVIQITPLPRTQQFLDELEFASGTIIPQAMARACDPQTPEVRDCVLLATSHLAAHIARLKLALENGEPDGFETQAALHGFWLYRDATIYWRDQKVRWPSLEGEAP